VSYNKSKMRWKVIRSLLFDFFGALCLLTASVTFAQLPNQPETVFPSDSQDAHQTQGARLLATVCPGSVEIVAQQVVRTTRISAESESGFPGPWKQ
jgi:hypothetical protein